MAIIVATTANANPGELRGQLASTYQDLIHVGPQSPTPIPSSPMSTTIRSLSVPLSFGQENAMWTKMYTATPIDTGSCIVTASGAMFNVTLTPSASSITFGDMVISSLNSALTAVHIHGPCLRSTSNNDGASCNAGPVYTICGAPGGRPCPLTDSNGALTVPGFTLTPGSNPSSLQYTLYQDMMTGANLYYVNFHTNA
jgi:hypothetical protein